MNTGIEIPLLNPIQLYKPEELVCSCEPSSHTYYQLFSQTDETVLQLLTNGVAYVLSASIVNEFGGKVNDIPVTYFNASTGDKVFELHPDFNINDGLYKVVVELYSGGENNICRLESKCFKIVEDTCDTIFIEYGNSDNDFNTIFENNTVFGIRVQGGFNPNALSPNSVDTIYQTQTVNFKQLKSDPYDTYRLNIGGIYGISSEVISLINRAFSCESLSINGVGYTKTEDSAFEAIESENYPFRGWSILLIKSDNSFYKEGCEVSEVVPDYVPLNNSYCEQVEEPPVMYTVTATKSGLGNGIVNPTTQEVEEGSSAIISAIPDENSDFAGWFEGITLISTSTILTLENITSDRTVNAMFNQKESPLPTNYIHITGLGTSTLHATADSPVTSQLTITVQFTFEDVGTIHSMDIIILNNGTTGFNSTSGNVGEINSIIISPDSDSTYIYVGEVG